MYNPFSDSILHDPSTALCDIPGLQDEALAACWEVIQTVRTGGNTRSLLVTGQQGAGKTHLVTRLRADLQAKKVDISLIYLRLRSAGQIWSDLRQEFVTTLVHRQSPTDSSLLDKILAWRLKITNTKNGSLIQSLQNLFGTQPTSLAASGLRLPHQLSTLLPQLYQGNNKQLSENWLVGESLSEVDLKKLNLSHHDLDERQRETLSRNLVIGLCRLAGSEFPLILCFDQIEGIQVTSTDQQSLCTYAKVIDTLHTVSAAKLILVNLILAAASTLMKEAAGETYSKRIAQRSVALKSLDREQCGALTAGRIEAYKKAVPVEQQLQLKCPAHQFDKLWIGKAYRNAALDASGVTPRRWLEICDREYQAGPPADLSDNWSTLINKWKPNVAQIPSILEKGVPLLAEVLRDEPFELGSLCGDFQVVVKHSADTTVLKVCSCHDIPGSLWRKLDRVKKSISPRSKDRVVLIRRQKDELTAGCLSRVKELKKGGSVWLDLHDDQLRAIDILVTMHSDALNGKVFLDGMPVGAEFVRQWFRQTLSEHHLALKELGLAVFDDWLNIPISAKNGSVLSVR